MCEFFLRYFSPDFVFLCRSSLLPSVSSDVLCWLRRNWRVPHRHSRHLISRSFMRSSRLSRLLSWREITPGPAFRVFLFSISCPLPVHVCFSRTAMSLTPRRDVRIGGPGGGWWRREYGIPFPHSLASPRWISLFPVVGVWHPASCRAHLVHPVTGCRAAAGS